MYTISTIPKERFDAADITVTHFTEPGVILTTEEEKQFAATISACKTFDELFTLMRSIEAGIPGTSRVYPSAEVIKRIDQVRNGHENLQRVTRTFGINDKVAELLKTDRTFAKRVLKKIVVYHLVDCHPLLELRNKSFGINLHSPLAKHTPLWSVFC